MINLEQLSTNFIGEITERQVATEILKMGYLVSKPLVQSSKYDFILDVNHKLYKIQVKTSSPDKENTYISFTTSISHTNTKRTINLSYLEEDVDFLQQYIIMNVIQFLILCVANGHKDLDWLLRKTDKQKGFYLQKIFVQKKYYKIYNYYFEKLKILKLYI